MGRVHVVGSINMDLVARVADFPRPGQTIAGADFRSLPGGKGANQAVAAARSGAATRIVGCVGNDSAGRELAEFLDLAGVDVSGLRTVDSTATGRALILVSDAGENSIVVVPGANGCTGAAEINFVPAAGDVVVSPLEIGDEAILAAFRVASTASATTILNPAPARVCAPEMLALADILVVNETELAFYGAFEAREDMPLAEVSAAVGKLAKRYGSTVIATLGGRGLVAMAEGEAIVLAAHAVEVVDTTAAGDTFVGSLAASLAVGESLRSGLNCATAAAALCVGRVGAAPSIPNRAEVRAFRERAAPLA
ncbi:MAG: ribokinase [bacterium]